MVNLSRVQVACIIQPARFANIVANADMRVGEIRQYCKLQAESQSLMRAAINQLNLTARISRREFANFGYWSLKKIRQGV